ncbi:LON peptidase substrate-binding domain-containing protein [Halopseudomonas pelagia]|uniref:LON peptidase substrate-binding domain-containing protein n=1 Tax=Halopseudomonas pelagia TaxID=553151 RepID=UPI0003B567A8|nr:LON peptidase substrate-binding domain-containing protein [Halopseudomonas pelagia]
MIDRRALFPLKSILLPGCVMDLQIFEARYLDMVSRCFKRDESFLIMPLESGPETGLGDLRFAAIGCEARIVDWQQRDNGLLGLRVEGCRRGHVSAVKVATDGLVTGQVLWLEEQPDQVLDSQHEDLKALHAALLDHPIAEGLGLPALMDSQQQLSYELVFLLPFSLEQKSALLATESPGERLQQISEWLELMQA